MYLRWTQHLKTEEEKQSFTRQVYSAKQVLDRLNEMIQQDYEMLDRSEENQRIYENPSWAYLQAHKNGNRQYMAEMLRLTNLDQQKGPNNDTTG